MTKLQKELPNAKNLIISSNLMQGYSLEVNYLDYSFCFRGGIKTNKCAYLNSKGEVEKKLKKKNVRLANIQTNNTYPNDQGHYIWFELMEEYFKLKK
ncbi:hypothetical protein JMN23_25515 [Bacillus sp. RHFB]|nr:hypothetical protein [Bacillus sp. RHFB]